MNGGEYTKMSTLGHRKCYDSHSLFKDWMRWGEGESYCKSNNLYIYVTGSEVGAWGRDLGSWYRERNMLTILHLKAPPRQSTLLVQDGDCCPGNSSYSCFSNLKLFSISPHSPSFKAWLSSHISNKLSPAILQFSYKLYHVIYLFIRTILNKCSFSSFFFPSWSWVLKFLYYIDLLPHTGKGKPYLPQAF